MAKRRETAVAGRRYGATEIKYIEFKIRFSQRRRQLITYSFAPARLTGLHFFSLAFNGQYGQIYTETGTYQKRGSVFVHE